MGRDDWFRRRTWSEQDAADFEQRLRRCRGPASKAQSLRIQAFHLAEVGLHREALALLSRLLRDFPEPCQLASSFLQRAKSLAALQDCDGAIESFRAALAAEDGYPNMLPGSPLEFAWFIVSRERTELYREVESLLLRHEGKHGVTFPVERFKCAAAREIVADEQGRPADAERFACEARDAAQERHSGFRYHPDLGVVDHVPAGIARRLATIGGVSPGDAAG